MMDHNKQISLLWPMDFNNLDSQFWNNQFDTLITDVDFVRILKELSIDKSNPVKDSFILSILTSNENVIKYRQKVIQDLLKNEDIVTCFQRVLPMLDQIRNTGILTDIKGEQLLRVVQQLGTLDLYVSCICDLHSTLQNNITNTESEALLDLFDMLSSIVQEKAYLDLKQELPGLKEQFEKLRSVTIGINLDPQLRAKEAVLLSINENSLREGHL